MAEAPIFQSIIETETVFLSDGYGPFGYSAKE